MISLIPQEWVFGKASDFVTDPKNDIVDGPFGSNLKASEYQPSGVPIIRLQNIKRLRFINKNIQYVTDEKALALSRHSYKRGDIAITKLGDPLGLACIIPDNFEDGIIVADLVRLRTNEKLFDKKFLTYALNSPLVINQLKKHIKGTTRPRINLGIIRDLDIPVTSIFEQKTIAEKLDTLLAQVDSTKARLEQIPKILKRFRQAVLAAATNGKLTKDLHDQNFYIDTDLGISVPSTWTACNVGNVAEVKGGKRLPKGESLIMEDSGFPYIRAGQLKEGTVISSGQLYLEERVQKTISKYTVSHGDIYITIVGACIGDSGIIPEKYHNANLTENAAKICDVDNKIFNKFLALWMRSNHLQNIIKNEIKSGAQGKLALSRIKSLPLIIPPLPEQHEIVRRVEQLFAYADIIEKQVNTALAWVNNLTQSILAKAFRGELTAHWRAENPDLISGENSAAALLEKIKAERTASTGKKLSRKKA